VLGPTLQKKCENFDKDNIDPSIVENLRPVIESPDFDAGKLKQASMAAFGLGEWVRAMVMYYDAMVIFKPKDAALKEANAKLAEANEKSQAAQAKLREVEAEVQKLKDSVTEAENKKKEL